MQANSSPPIGGESKDLRVPVPITSVAAAATSSSRQSFTIPSDSESDDELAPPALPPQIAGKKRGKEAISPEKNRGIKAQAISAPPTFTATHFSSDEAIKKAISLLGIAMK